jgi:hypothetical protein
VFLAHCWTVSEAYNKGISGKYRRIGKESDCWKLKIDSQGIKCKKGKIKEKLK